MTRWSRTTVAGGLYFAWVFAAGFVLGFARIVWLVPWMGTRTAELAELPIMLLVTIGAARYFASRLQVPYRLSNRLVMGSIGAALLLIAEFTLVLQVRGISLQEYFATRDPVSSTAYYGAVLAFAIMPLLVFRTHIALLRRKSDSDEALS